MKATRKNVKLRKLALLPPPLPSAKPTVKKGKLLAAGVAAHAHAGLSIGAFINIFLHR